MFCLSNAASRQAASVIYIVCPLPSHYCILAFNHLSIRLSPLLHSWIQMTLRTPTHLRYKYWVDEFKCATYTRLWSIKSRRMTSCISPERKLSVLPTVFVKLRKATKCDNPACHSLNTGVRNSDLLPRIDADARLRVYHVWASRDLPI